MVSWPGFCVVARRVPLSGPCRHVRSSCKALTTSLREFRPRFVFFGFQPPASAVAALPGPRRDLIKVYNVNYLIIELINKDG